MDQELSFKNQLDTSSLKISLFDFLKYSLLFTPSITFGLLKSEIFPWAIIISLFGFKTIDKKFLSIFFYLLIATIASIIAYGLTDNLRSLFSYLNVLMAFSFILTLSNLEVFKVLKVVKILFGILVIIGLLQHFNLIGFADPLLKYLIPRGSASALIEANRGVRILSSEPARAGSEIFFLYLILRYTIIKKKFRDYSDYLLIAFILIVIKSFMIFTLVLFFKFLNLKIKNFLGLVIVIITLGYFQFLPGDGRVIEVLQTITELGNWVNVWEFLLNTSGHRILTIYSSYTYAFKEILGVGLGNWFNGSINAIRSTGIDVSKLRYFQTYGGGGFIGTRSSGFLANVALEFGLFGLIIFSWYLFSYIKRFWKNNSDWRKIVTVFMIKILFLGSVGHPGSWITLAVLFRYYNSPNKIQNGL